MSDVPVAFVTDAVSRPIVLEGEDSPPVTSVRASARLRTLLPARHLARTRRVHLLPAAQLLRDPALTGHGELAGVVVGKVFSTGGIIARPAEARGFAAAVGAAAQRRPVLVDVCDDHIAQGALAGRGEPREYLESLGRVARLTAPTRALADAIAEVAHHGVTIVEDPYEGPAGTPRLPGMDGPIRMCWFGELTRHSVPPLAAALRAISKAPIERPMLLSVVANPEAAAWVRSASTDRVTAGFAPWSRAAAAQALADCDLVLLPQDWTSPWARSKSHNRLVEAIRAGRLALAQPIPAYRELAAYSWVGEDLAAGLVEVYSSPHAMIRRVAVGQDAIARRFAPPVVAQRWAAIIDGTDGEP